MSNTLGFIELNSIARGIETADAMVKAADVELLFSKPVCPGKFIILVFGDVGSVTASLNTGLKSGAQYVVDDMLLTNASPQLVPAICGLTKVEKQNAVGVVELFNIAGAIAAADAAVKAGAVQLLEIRLGVGIGGKAYFTLAGDVSSVEEAVAAGNILAAKNGILVESCVIASPCKEVFENLL